MPNFAAANKQVTDQLVLRQIASLHIDAAGVEFSQDYAHRGLGRGHSPYAKFYHNLNGPEQFMVVSGLPMVDASGDRLTPGWQATGPGFIAKKNLYSARIQGRDVELTVRNDDAVGRKQGWTLAYSPRLFVGGVEVVPAALVLLPVDPWNPNYQQNVLEWDYRVCKRKLRTVEGRVHGYWVFPANPGRDVLIRYGQMGDYRLKLGQYKQNDGEEFIPASVFALATYPFVVSDSATYYPDAHPETTSMDGYVGANAVDETWATIIADATGSDIVDFGNYLQAARIRTSTTLNQFAQNYRTFLIFDTSALPDTAIISAATLSVRGTDKSDGLSIAPDTNIYASTPASNTGLIAADYAQTQSVAFSTAITYSDWSTTTYNDFALNANGLANISLVGVSKFSEKNANYDVAASQPAWSDSLTSSMRGASAEQGDGFKPKLLIEYTVAIVGQPYIARVQRVAGMRTWGGNG